MRLCLRRALLALGLHKRILKSLCLLFLFIHTKHKTRWNLGLNPRLHSLEEFIHWVDKTKNLWLTTTQLLIKGGWWLASLALQWFSHKHKIPNIWVTQENPEDPRPLNSLDSHQTWYKMLSWTDPTSSFPWRRTHTLGR